MNDENTAIPSMGGSLDEFLTELGVRDEIYGAAVKEILAWQIERALKAAAISKTEVAKRMGTSRSQVDRLLDPENVAVSLESLASLAHSIGKTLKIELVDA